MTRLHELYTEAGQSPWIDNLSRDSIRSGAPARNWSTKASGG